VAVYINHQWYVAAYNGKVAVYQGVHGSAAGIELSHLHTLTNLPVSALPQDDRDRIASRIEASGGQDGATAVVANLRSAACALATASPTPSPTPTHRSKKSARNSQSKPPPAPPVWCAAKP
jgi:protein phosphatase